jgi:caffeoyl-CoA O-methyltransferase
VTVVPARVHTARCLRRVLRAGLLGQREPVHVRPDEEPPRQAPRAAAAPVEIRGDAGPADRAARREPDLLEPLRDPFRRPRLLESELGMTVQVAARFDEGPELFGRKLGQDSTERVRVGGHARILQKRSLHPSALVIIGPMTPLVAPELDRYVLDLVPPREPVLAEMEAVARERDVPIVGPAVGTLLALLAESISAHRICELGSAIGYSTAFFARAVGEGGRVIYTDGSEANAREAKGYLERMGLADRVELKVGDAVKSLQATSGDFDVIFIDVDKDGYPEALAAAADRVRPGGYLLADNVLWSGKVVDRSVRDTATEGIREFNRLLFARRDYRSVIVPLRDGVAIARRTTL